MKPAPVSIIVIARNEEALVADCLRSVVNAAGAFPGAQMVLVDSASTDRTVEIARRFPIRILSLPRDQFLSASAGRYVGFYHTTGEVVFFIDGDCTVDPQWLARAVPEVLARPSVAAVSGFEDEWYDDGLEPPVIRNVTRRPDDIIELRQLRGIGLYRRSALEQVGSFNPYLVCGEEGELALRLLRAGYRLLHLPYPMSCHKRGIRIGLSKSRREHKLGRHHGAGITLRYAWSVGTFWQFLIAEAWYITSFAMAVCLALVGFFLVALSGRRWLLGGWLALLLTAAVLTSVRKRDPMGFFHVVIGRTLFLVGAITGFFQTQVRPPESYPLEAIELEASVAPVSEAAFAGEARPLTERPLRVAVAGRTEKKDDAGKEA